VPAAQLLPAADRGLLLLEFRAELARRRRSGGLSQARLASRMGFDRTTVNKVERGALEPSREFARQAELVLEAHGELWRNIQREYSEEFLGRLDHDGTAGAPIDYRAEEPFRSMDAARRSGRVRVWCLGVGLDPLTLWGEILTVAVFDDEVFDELFSELVLANDEGVVVTVASPGRLAHGVPFVEERVEQLLGAEPMAPAAAACLALAWRDRETMLAN
jgi:transcriptional regulator with XRE-family HTH domain